MLRFPFKKMNFFLSVALWSICLFLRSPNVAAQACVDANAQVGSCLPLTTCPQLVEEYYSQVAASLNNNIQTFLGSSICGFDGYNFLICCAHKGASKANRKKEEVTTSTTNARDPSNNLLYANSPAGRLHFSSLSDSNVIPVVDVYIKPTISSNEPPVILNNNPQSTVQHIADCGIGSASSFRVVGGMEASRNAYPWIAALGYLEAFDQTQLKFLCAGSLINNRYVVTSAHCINPALHMVRMGAHNILKSNEPNAVDLLIKRTVVHESFNLTSISNDIALIELKAAVLSTASVRPICLPENKEFQNQDFVGMNPFVAGWGAVKRHGPTSNVLRDAQVPIVNKQTCEQNYKTIFKSIDFSEKLICAGNSNVDSCQGDSGGPLMLPKLDGRSYRFYLLGIVSFGYECAQSGFPGVYTRVASYIPWIKEHIF